MGSRYATPPQSTPNDTHPQHSRPSLPGLVGIKEGTVASRIQACNERESRAEVPFRAKEIRARKAPQQSSDQPGSSSQTTHNKGQLRADEGAAYVWSDEPKDGLHRRNRSGEDEERKVSDYTNGDERQSTRGQESPPEACPLRRVASQHSVSYSRPVPTTYTTERDRSGSYVMVGAKNRNNVEATSPYAVMRPKETGSLSTMANNKQKSRDTIKPIQTPEWQEKCSTLHHVDHIQGACNTYLRASLHKSFIPVLRKKPDGMVREENISSSLERRTGGDGATSAFGEELGKIIDMLDIMSADHVHQIRRIAHRMSPRWLSTRLPCHQDNASAQVTLHNAGQTLPDGQISGNESFSADLHALIRLVELSADSWTDPQTRMLIESTTSDRSRLRRSERGPLAGTPSPLFVASMDNPNDTAIELTRADYLALTAEPSSGAPSTSNEECRRTERMTLQTKPKTVTFEGQALTWTPLRLN